MHKHMHKKAPIDFQPLAHTPEKRRPVAHVLEHLDRDDAVVAPAGVEIVHVAGDDLHVGKAPP